MAVEIKGGASNNEAEVNSNSQLQVVTGFSDAPETIGGIRIFSENDPGATPSDAFLVSPESDSDFRLRTSTDYQLDNEVFNYTAQNTGKFFYRNTTMTNVWSAAGLTTNGGNILTTGTGTVLQTYQTYPLLGSTQLYVEMEISFTALPNSNTVVDFGIALASSTWPYAATDGVYFRLSSAGLSGIVNNNTTETTTGVLPFPYNINEKYQFIIAISTREVLFWVNNQLKYRLETPIGQGAPFMAAAVPFYFRHVINGGTAGSIFNAILNSYAINLAGVNIADKMSTVGNRIYGSYQGLSGGTMGSLANYANSANPLPVVPTNTTAALGTGLGGQFWETDTLAVTTDGIICSYQVPAATSNIQGRRLVLRGVNVQSFVQTALTGGGYVAQWCVAFGHTLVSLATTDGPVTKGPRRVGIGLQAVASGAVAGTVLSSIQINFDSPIYVNSGEFVQIVKKKIGTAPSAGVIAHLITLDYGWE